MSQQTGARPPVGPGEQTGASTTQVARDEAGDLGRTAAGAGQQVAGTAADQAGVVAGEARRQAKDLYGQARDQATEQARAGQQRAAQGVRSLAGELRQMADGGDRHGPVSDLAAQAAGRAEDLASWLDRHEPGDLLTEVRAYARRRPGTFLLGAAVAGVLAGRLTRGAVDANRDTGGPATPTAPHPAAGPPPTVPNQAPPPYPNGGPASGYPAVAPPPYDPGRPAGPPPYDLGRPPGPPPYDPARPPGPPPHDGPPVPMPPPPPGPGLAPPGAAPYPPPDYPAGPAHAPRPGASTVGEYVDELQRGAAEPRHGSRPDQP